MNIDVVVATPTGDVAVEAESEHHVQSLLAEVLARMGRRFNRGDVGQYDLEKDGRRLEPLHTLTSAGVEHGDELALEVNPTAA